MLKRGISMIVGTLLSMCYIVASPFLPTKTEIIETGKLVNGYWIKIIRKEGIMIGQGLFIM